MEPVTISAAFDLYIRDFLRAKNQADKTEEGYANAQLLLIRRFGDMDLREFTLMHARSWREWLFEWQSNNTVKNNVSCLRMVLKYLKKRGYDVMDFEEIEVPKRDKQVIKYLNEEEVREFLFEAAKKRRGYSEKSRLRNLAVIHLLYASGLRNGELCALNRDSIKDRQFTVSGKSKEDRIVFIDERTDKIIRDYLETRTDSNRAMFISTISGKRLTSKGLRDIFTRVCENTDKLYLKDVHPHTIRHSYGTKMLHRGVDLRFIGDLMGHQSLETTKIYTHYENPQLKAIYDKAHEMSLLT